MNEKIYTSVPIDKTAALAVSKDNDRKIDGKEKWCSYMTLIKPPTINGTSFSKKRHDLTGLKIGSFTVIGIFIRQNPKVNLRWVVHCKCGYYTVRSGKAINGFKDRPWEACCESCKYNNNLSKSIENL